MSTADRLIEAMDAAFPGDELEMDAAAIEGMITALAPITREDVVMSMQGSDDKFVGVYEGFDEMRTGWTDWLGAFERLRFELDEVEQIGDNVLMVGTQTGTTRHGGVEIEQQSAVVWKFREGEVSRVEFHLDRDMARRSAELA